jgi:hypothetical protein
LTSQSFPGRAKYLFFGRECNVHKDKSPSDRRGKKGSLIEKGGILLLNGKVSIKGLDSCVAITLSVQLEVTLSVIFDS